MSTVYTSRHAQKSYRPVRVPSFRSSVWGMVDNWGVGGTAVVASLGALALLDGALFLIIGLR